MDLARKIDAFIITILEGICHRTQRMFGLTSVTWERWALLIAALYIVNDWGKDSLSIKWLDGLILSQRIIDFLRSYSKQTGGTVMNSKKITERGWRLLFLALSVLQFPPTVFTEGRAGSYWLEFVTLSMYLAACDDLPWGESKIKQAWRSLTVAVTSSTEATEAA
jgi:hypothetical protein